MVRLQSDSGIASQRATELARGVQTLSSAGTVTKDSRTTVQGNTNGASNAIELSQSTATQVMAVINAMSQNLQGVSNSFQAMDVSIGNSLSNVESSNGFSLNGPR